MCVRRTQVGIGRIYHLCLIYKQAFVSIITVIIIDTIADKKYEQKMKHLLDENTKTQEKIRELTNEVEQNRELTKEVEQKRDKQ